MTYVLIIIMWGWSAGMTTTAEFTSEAKCKDAAKAVLDNTKAADHVRAICVLK